MADNFSDIPIALRDPFSTAVAITPHATNAITDIPRAIYVGTGGDITGRGVNDSADRLWKAVPTGTVLAFRFKYIRVTGTSAADMLALY